MFWSSRSNDKKKKVKKDGSKSKGDHAKERSARGKVKESCRMNSGRRSKHVKKKRSSISKMVETPPTPRKDKDPLGSELQKLQKVVQDDDKCVAIRMNLPKDFIYTAREVDDDEVNKLVNKFREHRQNATIATKESSADLKSQLVLDRVNKKTLSARYKKRNGSCEKDNSYMNTVPIKIQTYLKEERATMDKTIMLPVNNTDSGSPLTGTASASDSFPMKAPVEAKQPPKVEIPPEIIFNDVGIPYWMAYLEPMDEDLEGMEPAIPVGSEHLEMFHDKKFTLAKPPTAKVVLDQWQGMTKLAARDKLFFTPELVFSNTLRSLINVATKMKKSSDPGTVQENDERMVTFILPIKKNMVLYSRADPIQSVLKLKESLTCKTAVSPPQSPLSAPSPNTKSSSSYLS